MGSNIFQGGGVKLFPGGGGGLVGGRVCGGRVGQVLSWLGAEFVRGRDVHLPLTSIIE